MLSKNFFALVSFCNLPASYHHALVCLEVTPDKKKAFYCEPAAIKTINKPIRSVTGLAVNSNGVFFMFLSEGAFYLAALKREDLTLAYYQELPEVKDGHSILAVGDNLYVVSTGTDEVLRYTLAGNEVRDPEVFWRASNSGADTHHVNSIMEINAEIFVSAFGPKEGVLWSSAVNGYIHNITSDTRVKEGIYHPHSLSKMNGMLYYCDSSRKALCSLEKNQFKVDGYARGIAWLSDESVCVGSSIGRRISKSTGLIANPADPGEVAGRSKISIGNINDQRVIAEFDLSRFGPEIYDILLLEGGVNTTNLLRLK
jgi:hypothetical protein